jgi:hypothetical protein
LAKINLEPQISQRGSTATEGIVGVDVKKSSQNAMNFAYRIADSDGASLH